MIILGMVLFVLIWVWAWGAYCQVRKSREVFESINAWERAKEL